MTELNFYTVQRLCAGVDMALKEPVVDLSGVTFVRPFGIIYLGMFLRYHNAQGRGFQVTLPRDPQVSRSLATQRFQKRFNLAPSRLDDLVPVPNFTSLNDIIDLEKSETVAEDVAY